MGHVPHARAISMMPAIVTALAALGGLGGCHGGYDHRFTYEPRPAAVETPVPEDGSAGEARALVAVIGVLRAVHETDQPAAVEVRLRLDNGTDREITLDPASLELVAGNLESFGPPDVEPPVAQVVAPAASTRLTARFPFPGDDVPGTLDLEGLVLRWNLVVDGQPRPASAAFTRRRYEDRYIRSHWDIHGHGHHGVHGIHHHPWSWCR